jgi:rSAM/selenodomain-associated transferase 1
MRSSIHRVRVRAKAFTCRYRRRIGKSKISGTIKGVIGAGVKILPTIFKLALGLRRGQNRAMDERLIVFTRYPEPGKTKTRLIPALGPEGAAELQRSMTEDTLNNARRLKTRRPVSLEVRYEGGNKTLMQEWLGQHLTFRSQGGGDLGARIKMAFHDAFRAGARRVVIIGTDCPNLNSELLETAFDDLQRSDIVIGPANDGGYYLIGLRRPLPQLFDGIRWGSDKVLEQTLQRAREANVHPSLLTTLSDVDRPEDLAFFE